MCGGELVARADDTPEAVQGRLRDYHDKTRPVLDLFRAKEVVVAVDATGPVEQVQAGIHEQLGVEMSSGTPAPAVSSRPRPRSKRRSSSTRQ
jgi:adenylate kinase